MHQQNYSNTGIIKIKLFYATNCILIVYCLHQYGGWVRDIRNNNVMAHL